MKRHTHTLQVTKDLYKIFDYRLIKNYLTYFVLCSIFKSVLLRDSVAATIGPLGKLL